MGALCCCIFPTQKTPGPSPWEKIHLWVNITFTWKSRVGKKATALPLIVGIIHRTITSQSPRQHGLLFAYTKPAYSFIFKRKRSGEKIVLWQTCTQKKTWGQIFRWHKSAAVEERHWFTSAKCQALNHHWHTVEKQAFPRIRAIAEQFLSLNQDSFLLPVSIQMYIEVLLCALRFCCSCCFS